MTSVSTDTPSSESGIRRWEWIALIGILLVAVALRFALPGRMAVEHFDEGVYASNIWFGDSREGAYPAQHLYAPPLLPALIEWVFVFSAPSNTAAMIPNQVAGSISVVLLWWIGRTWFGPVAGLVAAALGATNEVHILLSRSALTDALLGMWWLASLWALRRACESGSSGDRLAAGLLIGLAWFTKYNGWMPLGIATGAVLLRGLLCPGIWPQTKTALTSCLIAGVIAFATWSPWLWSLQSKGGYASVAANHRQYVVGLSGWWSSAVRQSQQLTAMFGPITKLGTEVTFLLLLISLAILRRQRESAPIRSPAKPLTDQTAASSIAKIFPVVSVLFVCVVAQIAPRFGWSILVPLGIVVWWIPHEWWYAEKSAQSWLRRHLDLGHWILGVWLIGLLMATPLYTPYLRLTLPGLLAAFVGTGAALQPVWQLSRSIDSNQRLFGILLGITATQVMLFGSSLLLVLRPPVVGPASRPQQAIPNQARFPAECRAIAETGNKAERPADEPRPVVVYVYAEPSLLFQLRLAGLQNVAPVSSLQFARSQFTTPAARIYLAVGIHARKDPRFQKQFTATRGQFKEVGRWPWKLGPLVALDQSDCDPKFLGRNPGESAAIELYEVLPP